MRMIQLLPTLAFGDAVSNDAIALKQVIKELGYKTEIYAENVDKRLPKGMVCPIAKMPEVEKNDILIYHLSTGTKLNYQIAEHKCKKIIIYHNITPPVFFEGYSEAGYILSSEGLKGANYLSNKVDYCLADSVFNKENLIDMSYKAKIDVLPILIPFDDYKKKPAKDIIKKYNDSIINIVFTGRIAPNKKQEDIIEAFYYYKKYINKSARLFFVGSYSGMGKYYEQLKTYVKALELDDVYFTGHIKFDEIIAYYKIADVFLCMSEHEGFCVPLVEAMYFDVPIIAYDSTAIADTLGGSGLLLKEKHPMITAELVHKLMIDKSLRQTVVENQRVRLKDFEYETIKKQFVEYITKFVEDKK